MEDVSCRKDTYIYSMSTSLLRRGTKGPRRPAVLHFDDAEYTPSIEMPFCIGQCNFSWSKDPIELPNHVHAGVEFTAILSGTATIDINGMYYSLEPYDCYFLQAQVPHGMTAGPGMITFYSHISDEALLSIPCPQESLRLLRIFTRPANNSGTVIMKQKEATLILQKAKDLFLDTHQVFHRTAAWSHLLLSLQSAFSAIFPETKDQLFETKENEDRIFKSLQYIHHNFRIPLEAEKLAQCAMLSVSHFYSIFKTTMHCTPNEYVNRIRINHALRVLVDSNRKIESVAYESGFENLASFYYQFRKIMGAPPQSFRKN